MPFKCFVQNGSHRLYVANRLGIKKVVIERVKDFQWDYDFELFFESAMDAYDVGVRNWNQVKVIEDLKRLAISSTQEMVEAYMMNSSFEEQQKKEVMCIDE